MFRPCFPLKVRQFFCYEKNCTVQIHAMSKVENSAQVSSCQLKSVHALRSWLCLDFRRLVRKSLTWQPGWTMLQNFFLPLTNLLEKQARVFATAESFQPSLMFVNKARACNRRAGSWPYVQEIDSLAWIVLIWINTQAYLSSASLMKKKDL